MNSEGGLVVGKWKGQDVAVLAMRSKAQFKFIQAKDSGVNYFIVYPELLGNILLKDYSGKQGARDHETISVIV
jgi:hypothetical protein